MLPENWIKYHKDQLIDELVDARATIRAIQITPFYREWAEKLQQLELKREIAGTTMIEGAAFTEREFDEAVSETSEQLRTRSQRQARAIKKAFNWIISIPDDEPITAELILNVHRLIITDADDDHCPPGQVRTIEQDVTFGQPRRRGVPGGTECMSALVILTNAIQRDYPNHDPLIQALAVHYHIGAIHPFSDGNGRTARALETLMLQRAGLRDTAYVSMSNYYYEERVNYLKVLGEVRELNHDLTPFLKFGLKGITLQCNRLLGEIKPYLQKALFRNLMHDLFGRMRSPRRRVIAKRQLAILDLLLSEDCIDSDELYDRNKHNYQNLKVPFKAFIRDLITLKNLGTIHVIKNEEGNYIFSIRLEWPTWIVESDFLKVIKKLPKAKTLQ